MMMYLFIGMKQSLCPICSSPKKESNKFCSYSCRNKSRVWTDDSRKRMSDSVKKSIEKDYTSLDVTCSTCGENQIIRVHKKSKPKKFYCSLKCSKSRNHTDAVKSNISKSLKLRSSITGTSSNTEKKCVLCSENFSSNKKNQKFCSRSCASKFNMSLTENREKSRERMKQTLKGLSTKRRSKNEELFYELCVNEYINVKHNDPIFDGWDADVLLPDYKVAVLWNGKWHYEKITEKHSVKQVQNRDKIKMKAIRRLGWVPYVIKDMGRHNVKFVQNEFDLFKDWMKNNLEMSR